MKRLAAIASLLLVLALLPLKTYLVRFGWLPELTVVFLTAMVVVTLVSYAILGDNKRF